jgi:hypothetical protein
MPTDRRAIKKGQAHPREECVRPTARPHAAEGFSAYPPIATIPTPPGDGDDVGAPEEDCASGWFVDPFYTIAETQRLLRSSRASVYRWVAKDKLDLRKLEGKALITGQSLRRLAANLPKANIRLNGSRRALSGSTPVAASNGRRGKRASR